MEEQLILADGTSLSALELMVIRYASLGMSNKEIGKKLGYSHRTIEHMLGTWDADRSIYIKIKAKNRRDVFYWYSDFLGRPGKEKEIILGSEFGTNMDKTIVAKEAGIRLDILSKFLDGQVGLEDVDRRTFLKLMGLVSLAVANIRYQSVTTDWPRRGESTERVTLDSDLLLNISDNDLENVRNIRRLGEPEHTSIIASIKSDQLKQIIRSNSGSKIEPLLQIIRGRILLEKAGALCDSLPASQVLSNIRPIINEVYKIAKAIGDRELFVEGIVMLAGCYYILGQHDVSVRLHSSVRDYINDPDIRLLLLRALGTSYAYLSEKNEFELVVDEEDDVIQGGNWTRLDQVCATLQGRAKGQAILGLDSSMPTLDQAVETYNLMEEHGDKMPLRRIQISATELEIASSFSPSDIQALENIGRMSHQLAIEHGYRRHANQVDKFLIQHLN